MTNKDQSLIKKNDSLVQVNDNLSLLAKLRESFGNNASQQGSQCGILKRLLQSANSRQHPTQIFFQEQQVKSLQLSRVLHRDL